MFTMTALVEALQCARAGFRPSARLGLSDRDGEARFNADVPLVGDLDQTMPAISAGICLPMTGIPRP